MTEIRTLRQFSYGAALIISIAAAITPISSTIAIVFAIALCAVARCAPHKIAPIYTQWMRFATIWGHWNTKFILAIVFYGVCFPIGLLKRLCTKDILERSWGNQDSYRMISSLPSNMERPF